jgi:hypothetical protein
MPLFFWKRSRKDKSHWNAKALSLLHSTGAALKKFAATRSERLPVVDGLITQRLIGSLSKADIILHLAGEESRPGNCDRAVEAAYSS